MIVRIRFGKEGKVRWTSHRDVARIWERALRRARLPVSYTAGFSPRPQLSFGLALPTGCESIAEYLDVVLDSEVDPEQFATLVRPMLPTGIEVFAAAIPKAGLGSLQEEVSSCTWEVSVPEWTIDELESAAADAMAASSLPIERERKGRSVHDDLRPSLIALSVFPAATSGGSTLQAELGTRPRGVRPTELARVMQVEFGSTKRTCQWIERDGSKFEPLSLRQAVAAGAEDVAS